MYPVSNCYLFCGSGRAKFPLWELMFLSIFSSNNETDHFPVLNQRPYSGWRTTRSLKHWLKTAIFFGWAVHIKASQGKELSFLSLIISVECQKVLTSLVPHCVSGVFKKEKKGNRQDNHLEFFLHDKTVVNHSMISIRGEWLARRTKHETVNFWLSNARVSPGSNNNSKTKQA